MTTENQPSGAPSPAPDDDQVDELREPLPVEPYKTPVPKDRKGSGKYSAYDTTLGRYVGGVHDSKAKAKAAAEDADVADFTVVEV